MSKRWKPVGDPKVEIDIIRAKSEALVWASGPANQRFLSLLLSLIIMKFTHHFATMTCGIALESWTRKVPCKFSLDPWGKILLLSCICIVRLYKSLKFFINNKSSKYFVPPFINILYSLNIKVRYKIMFFMS